MSAMEKQITRVETGYKQSDLDMKALLAEARARIEVSEGRNSGKIETMASQVNSVSIKLSGIESSVQFLVKSQRRRPNE